MKKVCHLSSAHLGLDTRIYHKECLSLAKAGYDTHLVTNATADDVHAAAVQKVILHALAPEPPQGRGQRMLRHAWRCYRVARDLDADLYHLHDPELTPHGILLAWSGKKVIYDAHEDLAGEIQSKYWIPSWARAIAANICTLVLRFATRQFSAVVAATPFIATLFPQRRVEVVNNYPLPDELNRPSTFSHHRDSVCYVGAIEHIRGIREIVQAAGKAKARLLLAGRFVTETLRDEIRACEGWQQVQELGFVDRSGVSSVLARSFSGLVTLHPVPNYVNSQPIKMFEYMSAEVPVIASDFPMWREVVEGNDCGICVDPQDPEAISAAICRLRDNPGEVERMGKNGRLAVEKKYRWDNEEKKLLSLYRELLGE